MWLRNAKSRPLFFLLAPSGTRTPTLIGTVASPPAADNPSASQTDNISLSGHAAPYPAAQALRVRGIMVIAVHGEGLLRNAWWFVPET
jgi:hypothetical protein